MKKLITLLVITAFIVVVYSCRKNSGANVNTGSETVSLSLPKTTDQFFTSNTIFGVNIDSVNKVATLGRVLFYDTHLSINNAVSCGSCHKQAYAFADNAPLSAGFQGMPTKRNSLGITSLSQFSLLFWDGRENSLQNLILRPITNHVEMGIDDASVLPGKIGALPYYSQLFQDAFGDTAVTLTRISQAVALFVQAIGPSTNLTRLDQYNAGDLNALTAQEIYGKALFDTKYNCTGCHGGGGVFIGGGGTYGGNQTFKDIGLDANYVDMGRGAITGNPADNGTFLVPNLRNVALTAPYMHDGRYATLNQVVEHYSHNIVASPNLDPLLKDATGAPKQFNISQTDEAAIVAFLNTLTDYTTVTDPKFSNPFKVNN